MEVSLHLHSLYGPVQRLMFLKYLFFSCGSATQFWALAASMKVSVSFRLQGLGQSAVLLGWVISSSQGLCYLSQVIVMMEKLVE
jgi:hypothetical protein